MKGMSTKHRFVLILVLCSVLYNVNKAWRVEIGDMIPADLTSSKGKQQRQKEKENEIKLQENSLSWKEGVSEAIKALWLENWIKIVKSPCFEGLFCMTVFLKTDKDNKNYLRQKSGIERRIECATSFPYMDQKFSEFSEFRESDKSLKHKLGSI